MLSEPRRHIQAGELEEATQKREAKEAARDVRAEARREMEALLQVGAPSAPCAGCAGCGLRVWR